MTGLTPRQRVALECVSTFIEANGFPPTFRELAAELGIASTNAVECLLAALERKGAIRRSPGKARGLRVVAESRGAP